MAGKRRYTETVVYLQAIRRMMVSAGKRVAHGDADELRELAAIRNDVEEMIAHAIMGMRDDGYTWESIGEVFGTTKQGASQYWGPIIRRIQER